MTNPVPNKIAFEVRGYGLESGDALFGFRNANGDLLSTVWNDGRIFVPPTQAIPLKATVTLTDAQIKALPTTPIQIVAAPGANKVVMPLSCVASISDEAGGYASINANGWIVISTNVADLFYLAVNESPTWSIVTAFLSGPSQIVVLSAPSQLFIQGWGISANPLARTQVANKAVRISADNGGAVNYTGGNAANTLTVTLFYVIIDL